MDRLDSNVVQTRRRLGVAVLLCLVLSAQGRAKETDSFTHRYEALAFPAGEVDGRPLSDFTAEFNDHFRRLFAEVLADLNEENRRSAQSCLSQRSRRRLFHKMSNRLGGPVVLARNRLRPAINRQPNRFQPRMADSIYRGFSPWRSISLGLAAKLGHKMAALFRFDLEEVLVESGGAIARAPDGRLAVLGPQGVRTAMVFQPQRATPAIFEHAGRTYYLIDTGQALTEAAGEIRRVTPILVSSDKFSHFFNRSLGLFKRLRAGSDADFDRVLARNSWLEDSLFGSKSTGVAAYGDLAANFQGMRFWIHLLGQAIDGHPLPDPLQEERPAPIVECDAWGRWVQTRPPDILDYLDPAWDEALNCSRMRSRLLLGQVRRRIEGLEPEAEEGHSYDCPVSAEVIGGVAASYGRFAGQLINAAGHSSLRAAKKGRVARQSPR